MSPPLKGAAVDDFYKKRAARGNISTLIGPKIAGQLLSQIRQQKAVSAPKPTSILEV